MDLYEDPISQSLASKREIEDLSASSGLMITYCAAQRKPTTNSTHALVVRGLPQGSSEVGYRYRLLLVPRCAQKCTWLYWVKDARGD